MKKLLGSPATGSPSASSLPPAPAELSPGPLRILHRLRGEVRLDIQQFVEIKQVVDVVDGTQFVERGQRWIAARRPQDEISVLDIGPDGAELGRWQRYAAGIFRRTDPAPSAKKPPNSDWRANIATASNSCRSMMPGTARSPSMRH